ncbi:hypothetical protein SARC_11504 [Sphaeroforma arctica JP610]|uniref:Uncharacterized protein n=1 Tax=Sphaeroforma arctica JP610 TaxID=667725 RepID=A0A0L0FGS8_9EUKA|nr:hypothetical protein SARC_11504 [Sphaeroforma arctica JP610]KNC75984.1 hypothetical protein SARC_11504 [Sphaeroforma arctica JP610]|eukprot:XP_014149886.1 hypothetical protein SARC_11504 [Sphaeroforma arctica JP610]
MDGSICDTLTVSDMLNDLQLEREAMTDGEISTLGLSRDESSSTARGPGVDKEKDALFDKLRGFMVKYKWLKTVSRDFESIDKNLAELKVYLDRR